MKKTFPIFADCAACAIKMEDAAKKVAGVDDAVVNFMTQKMRIEFEAGADTDNVMKNVAKACKRVEPDCGLDF